MTSGELVLSVAETVKRFIWSRKATRTAAVRMIDAGYLMKKRLGAIRDTRLAAPTTDEGAGDLWPLERYRSQFGGLDGWFKEGAVATWDTLLAWQTVLGVHGNLMEIGVSKGKSAALIALRSRPDETCVFVDVALRRQAIDVIESIRPVNNLWLEEPSQHIRRAERLMSLAGTFRWIHVDGEHSGRAVLNDLEIAETMLSPEGVICLDDFMSPAYPQVTMAAFRFLDSRNGRFSLFLNGFNKGYISAAGYVPTYLRLLKDHLCQELRRRRFADFTVWKTADPNDMNCFGQTRKYLDYDFKGPDWAPHAMSI